MKNDRTLRVRVRFTLFHSELAPTDPWCNMLQTLIRPKKIGGNVRQTTNTPKKLGQCSKILMIT